jgi:hypothetical protein
LQEIRTAVTLAPAKPAGLPADLGVPSSGTAVVKKGRVHEFAQVLLDDNTAAPATGVGFEAVLLAGPERLASLSSSSLFLPYGNSWYPNRFVFEVPIEDFDRADRFEFIAKPEEVRSI